MRAWLLVLHLPAMVLWVGSLLVVTSVLAAHCREAGVEARNALARLENKIFRRMVHPGAALMVITGVLLVLAEPQVYMRAPWLHAKLLLVVFFGWAGFADLLPGKGLSIGQGRDAARRVYWLARRRGRGFSWNLDLGNDQTHLTLPALPVTSDSFRNRFQGGRNGLISLSPLGNPGIPAK